MMINHQIWQYPGTIRQIQIALIISLVAFHHGPSFPAGFTGQCWSLRHLGTYLFSYASIYDAFHLDQLVQMFSLDERTVHSTISKMMIKDGNGWLREMETTHSTQREIWITSHSTPGFSPGNSLAGLMGHHCHHHDQNITTGYH